MPKYIRRRTTTRRRRAIKKRRTYRRSSRLNKQQKMGLDTEKGKYSRTFDVTLQPNKLEFSKTISLFGARNA